MPLYEFHLFSLPEEGKYPPYPAYGRPWLYNPEKYEVCISEENCMFADQVFCTLC